MIYNMASDIDTHRIVWVLQETQNIFSSVQVAANSRKAAECLTSKGPQYYNQPHIMTFTAPQFKTEYLTECLLEVLNNRWKVDAIESNRSVYTQWEYEVGKKYIKVIQYMLVNGERNRGRSCVMFIDKKDGAVYKSASWKAPAKGIRFSLEGLVENPDICDCHGSFLYRR